MQLISVNPKLSPVQQKSDSLAELIEAYTKQKAILDEAKQKFAAIEEELTEEVGFKPEGSSTFHIHGHKITTTGRMTRKLDEKVWAKIAQAVPGPIVNRLIKTKLDIDLKELRYIQNNEPNLFEHIAQAITAKPGKPSIKVEKE